MKTRKTAVLAMLLGMGMILSYVDSLVPVFPIPGIKMGLANIAVLYTLLKVGIKEAWIVSFMRVFLMTLLFGNGVSMAYSVAGAFMSLFVMSVLYKLAFFDSYGISILGAVFHHVGQVMAAFYLVGSSVVFYYLPLLCLLSIITGLFVALLANLLLKRTGGLLRV